MSIILVLTPFQQAGGNYDQLIHPPHIISNSSSAFIPFCFYQSEPVLSGQQKTHKNLSFPICTSFQPTLLQGQLCYKLDLRLPSGQGKMNELMLILDYNTELSLHPKIRSSDINSKSFYLKSLDSDQYEAKIHINALSQMTNFGGGAYKMTVVKRMTVTPDFLKMSLKDRNCKVEEYEECRSRNLLKNCRCIPWDVPRYQASSQSSYLAFGVVFPFIRVI